MDDWKIITPIIQGGSFSLLAFITVWLTRWVPKRWLQWDKDREEDRKTQLAVAHEQKEAIESITSSQVTTVNDLVKCFKEESRYERETCEKRHAELMQHLILHREEITGVRHDLYGVATALNLSSMVRNKDEKSRTSPPSTNK
jgi:hypothetical protein